MSECFYKCVRVTWTNPKGRSPGSAVGSAGGYLQTGLAETGHDQLLVNHRSARIASQSWRFVTLEARIISHEKEAL
jgi:hypothetical protein